MKKALTCMFFFSLFLGMHTPLFAQFTIEELAERGKWERFLEEAEITEWNQPLNPRLAVTEPWRLKLEKDGIVKYGWWKNVDGRHKGFMDRWRWEIAAYRLDKLLGLNMIPPYVEKRFQGSRGAISLDTDYMMKVREKQEKKIKCPPRYVYSFNRATYLWRFWDNLIANADRNEGDIFITEDWRVIIIDHSRSFRTHKKFKHRGKGKDEPIKQLPRALVEKLKSIDFEMIRNAVGEYLTDKEIAAVLVRRELLLKEVDRLIEKFGENKFFY